MERARRSGSGNESEEEDLPDDFQYYSQIDAVMTGRPSVTPVHLLDSASYDEENDPSGSRPEAPGYSGQQVTPSSSGQQATPGSSVQQATPGFSGQQEPLDSSVQQATPGSSGQETTPGSSGQQAPGSSSKRSPEENNEIAEGRKSRECNSARADCGK